MGKIYLFILFLQIRIICGVDHEDLKQLFNVSKSIREAVSIMHFNLDYKLYIPCLTIQSDFDYDCSVLLRL